MAKEKKMIDQRKYIGCGFWNMFKIPTQKTNWKADLQFKIRLTYLIGIVLLGYLIIKFIVN